MPRLATVPLQGAEPAELGNPESASLTSFMALAATAATTSGPIDITALPQIVNLTLYAGDDFNLPFAVNDPDGQPANLSGATIRSQIRQTPASELAGEFIPNAIGNAVVLHLAGAVSGGLPASSVFDCEIETTDGRVKTVIAGTITLRPQVTRPEAG